MKVENTYKDQQKYKMKILPIILMTIMLILGGCATTTPSQKSITIIEEKVIIPEGCVKSTFGDYSYQSHIDPQIITEKWEFLKDFVIPIGPSQFELYYINTKDPIEIPISVFLVVEGSFLGFSYLYAGDVYLYFFDPTFKCYRGGKLEDGKAKEGFKKKFYTILKFKSI